MAHGFRGFKPCSLSPVVSGTCLEAEHHCAESRRELSPPLSRQNQNQGQGLKFPSEAKLIEVERTSALPKDLGTDVEEGTEMYK